MQEEGQHPRGRVGGIACPSHGGCRSPRFFAGLQRCRAGGSQRCSALTCGVSSARLWVKIPRCEGFWMPCASVWALDASILVVEAAPGGPARTGEARQDGSASALGSRGVGERCLQHLGGSPSTANSQDFCLDDGGGFRRQQMGCGKPSWAAGRVPRSALLRAGVSSPPS